MMTPQELETIADVARDMLELTTREIDSANSFIDEALIRWMKNTKKLAETIQWLCDEIKQTERRTREQVAADLRAVHCVEWALAGQQAGEDAAIIALGDR